ncbi:hypothetical protein [Bradyrhizobium sp. 45]|uniref:hypothetical protein n=1 Tax=Bradyrhizobium sp. 45 TaxID=1043587 RepID=UPI001FF7F499|nr:hypothetical protein [Bradyrhizobium sp. 45]MCK1305063.1 hypothetical protein [Bradyrhizobium sp. 45]
MSAQIELIKAIAELSLKMVHGSYIGDLLFREKKIDVRAEQLKLLQDLTEAKIDPSLFDLMLSSELDRTLKKQFGVSFFVATVVFTAASYAVIILNAVYHWGISDIAITALIVETPIQFIGLLYIIARNLFPQRTPAETSARHRQHAAAQHLPEQHQELAKPKRPRGRRGAQSQNPEADLLAHRSPDEGT